MDSRFCRFAIFISMLPLLASGNANQSLDRPYTLLNRTPFLLEEEYRRIIEGNHARSYILPRPCLSDLDSSQVCPEGGGWLFSNPDLRRKLRVSPIGGYEYRYVGSHAQAGNFGIVTEGGSGPVSFYLDARMFTEQYENLYHASYDREFVERQDENASGSVAYTSYSRYRSNLSYDWRWGRLSVARDAAHWGPGLFTNLAFQQEAVPFNQLTFTSHLGPLSVQSLYGQLAASRDWEFDTASQAKSIYAHRYELRAGKRLLFGVSEQLILHKIGAPFAFVPVVPLFIAKASEKERLNNGNLAGDVSYAIPGAGSIYSEFMIDDLQSPTSLFSDTWSNKWAWMAGTHLIRDFGLWKSGLILEYSRVEPWVYTHYLAKTAQTSHQDYPLGNPWGPNSQAMIGKIYFRLPGRYYLGLKIQGIWKGKSNGSELEDVRLPGESDEKHFLGDSAERHISAGPVFDWRWRYMNLWIRAEIGDGTRCVTGVRFQY